MKMKKLFPLLLLALSVCAITACSDDDDPKPSETNKEVVGTYEGWTHLETTYLNKNYPDDTFTLALAEDGSLTATFKDATWGVATIKGIQASATAKADEYSLSESEGSFVMNDIRSGATQEFPCKLESAVVNPKDHQMTAVISAYMEVGHGDMTFTFHTGKLPVITEEE